MPLKDKNQNRLFLIRKRNGLGQKQIAVLLGHKTIDQISRYERGVRLPSLKTALKLQIIYRLPVNVLFQSYYNKCLSEIQTEARICGNNFVLESNGNTEICTYSQLLRSLRVSPPDIDKVGKHILELMNARTEKLGHR